MFEVLTSGGVLDRESDLLQRHSPVIVRSQYIDAGLLQGTEQTPSASRFVVGTFAVVLAVPHRFILEQFGRVQENAQVVIRHRLVPPFQFRPCRGHARGRLLRVLNRGADIQIPTTIVGYGTTTPRQRNVPPDIAMWDGKRGMRTSKLRRIVDETWGLWLIPSYVCSGDSGGGIFLNRSPAVPDEALLVANVSDGGRDCRGHNNNNRLDTRSVQNWISETLRQHGER